ncbi:MAG TPA: DUF3035 domain-containing protein [Acetobacteraceae bacterium]|nr:DUF3035 domain-containing protein [Acetobacteraceae bacterium]
MLRFFTRVAPVLVAGGACLLLSACGGNDLARTMGFVRDAPDEFTVTTQAPLSMPPDFALRPPRPGAPRPQDRSTTVAAEQALAPQTALSTPADTGLSPGQQALIAQAGPAPANVAAQVDKQAELTKPSPGFIDRLMFWRSPAQPGDVVDAQQEAERLRKNAALGQSPATGPTPIIQSKPKGLLEGLF